jgi:amino acid adenylation domain-containing protein
MSAARLAIAKLEPGIPMNSLHNRGAVPPAPARGWWKIFEDRVAKDPERIALVAADATYTFAELDARATSMARWLRSQGVTPRDVVACAMHRSAQAVVVLLAVAKAGGVYLPVDVAAPRRRIRDLVNRARSRLLVTDEPDVQDVGSVPGLLVTSHNTFEGQHGEPEPSAPVSDGDPAYMIYTSGSTGQPKAVVLGSRGLVNLYRELCENYFPDVEQRLPDGETVRVAHGMPLTFDASWNPILWMLGGYELHMLPEEVRSDPELYVKTIRESRLNVVEAVPSMVEAMTGHGLLESETGPLMLLMGGEALGGALWTLLRETEGLTGVHLYGPTECTVFSTAAWLAESTEPNIGRPVRNTRIQVVDPEMRPVGTGEPGELLISGESLAHGYFDAPELTRERFVRLEGVEGGERWYRTGDVCRFLPGGELQFIGRLDKQVKIRGRRVEPGETEHVLLGHRGVRQAAVEAQGEGPDVLLVAYAVPLEGAEDPVTSNSLRAYLSARLPSHQVPDRFVILDGMPLTANGKIDRKALARQPSCGELPLHESGDLQPVGTPGSLQDVVTAEWCAVLKVAAADPAANFFDAGGHSLLAAQLASRLRARGLQCTMQDVLRHPTIQALTCHLVDDGKTEIGDR